MSEQEENDLSKFRVSFHVCLVPKRNIYKAKTESYAKSSTTDFHRNFHVGPFAEDVRRSFNFYMIYDASRQQP